MVILRSFFSRVEISCLRAKAHLVFLLLVLKIKLLSRVRLLKGKVLIIELQTKIPCLCGTKITDIEGSCGTTHKIKVNDVVE